MTVAYSPAVRVTCFVRDAEHREERRKKLSERLGPSALERSTVHELVDRVGEPEAQSWAMSDSPHGLPLFELRLFVNHPDGKHENVCLEAERSLIGDLLRDRLVDVADFSYGLPKKKPAWFSRKYESGTIDGGRSFVALALLKDGLFPELASVASSMRECLAKSWTFLEADRHQVSLNREQRRGFEVECAKLPHFHELSESMLAAAKRL